MDQATMVERVDDLLSTPVDKEIVFLSPKTDNYIALDEIGRRVWDLLEKPRRVADLIADLAVEFEGTQQTMTDDVISFLEELERERMVRVVDPA